MKILMSGVCALAVLTFVGCGGVKTYPVTGTVTLDGKPTEGLLVAFASTEGSFTASGTTDADGVYKLTSLQGPGLPSGTYKVSISEVTVVDNSGGGEEEEIYQSSNSAAYEQAAMSSSSAYDKAAKVKKKVPEKYNAKSTLQETVAEVSLNTIDFSLSSK